MPNITVELLRGRTVDQRRAFAAAVGRHHERWVWSSHVEQAEQRKQPKPCLSPGLTPVLARALKRGEEPLEAVGVVVDGVVDGE